MTNITKESVENNLQKGGIKLDHNWFKKRYGMEVEDVLKHDILSDIWQQNYSSPRGAILVSPTSAQTALSMFGFNKKDNIYPDLKDKKVTDIGSGSSGLAFELERSASQITVVDHFFDHYDKMELLDRDIKRAEHFIDFDEGKLEKIQEEQSKLYKELDQLKLIDTTESKILQQEKKDQIEKSMLIENNLKQSILDWGNVKDDTQKRKDNGLKGNEKIIVNPSGGENVKGIEDESQDIVFINFVLDKESADHYMILSEAMRILKPGAKLYSINNVNNDDKLVFFLKSQGIDYKIVKNRMIFTIKKQ